MDLNSEQKFIELFRLSSNESLCCVNSSILPQVAALFSRAEPVGFGNFVRVPYICKKQLCEIIMNLDQWCRGMPFRIFLIYSSGGHLVGRNKTIWAI